MGSEGESNKFHNITAIQLNGLRWLKKYAKTIIMVTKTTDSY